MDDIYKNIEDYNLNKKRKTFIVFDDMIADMLSNKKFNPIVTEIFIRGRKRNISLVMITQFYFAMSKDIWRICTILLWKFQINVNLNKLHPKIDQMLTFKTLLIFTKNVLQNYILFWLLAILLHQIILHVLERIL